MKNGTVINLEERVEQPMSSHVSSSRLGNLRTRFEMQNAKLAVSTTLLSIVVIVTVANHSLLGRQSQGHESRDMASLITPENANSMITTSEGGNRAIASIPTGTSEAEDSIVEKLAKKELSARSSFGHEPTELQKLTIGFLEGHYAVQLTNGKLRELQFSDTLLSDASDSGPIPKHVENLAAFIESNRNLLPVNFSKTIKLSERNEGDQVMQTFELVNQMSMPVARVEFVTDTSGGLLAMAVDQSQSVSK